MKSIKQGIALFLVALLMIPNIPVWVQGAEPEFEESAVPDMVQYNTGNGVCTVVPFSNGLETVTGAAVEEREGFGASDYFTENGSYTIRIPEVDPFFPYEVQFTYGGNVTNEWFMTPEDSVEIGGHTFYVAAEFTGTVVTQMSFCVAGDTVIVYPKEKEFPEYRVAGYSLLPLEEKSFQVDLSGYTPIELSMVKISTIFAGEREFTDTDKIMWAYVDDSWDETYTVAVPGDMIDMNQYNTCSSFRMIVGSNDQLDAGNVRYEISVNMPYYEENWLIPSIYTQREDEKRTKVTMLNRSDYWKDCVESEVPISEIGDAEGVYIGLELNPVIFPNPKFDHIKVYDSFFETLEEAMAGEEITDQIWESDLSQTNSGYFIELQRYNDWSDIIDLRISGHAVVTLITFDEEGNATGLTAVSLHIDVVTHPVVWGDVVPVVFTQNKIGERAEVEVKNGRFDIQNKELSMEILEDDVKNKDEVYLGLQPGFVRSSFGFDYFEIYEGKLETLEDVVSGKKITEQIWKIDMDEVDAGYKVELNSYFIGTGSGWGDCFWVDKNPDFQAPEITFVAFDTEGNPLDFRTITLDISVFCGDFGLNHLMDENGNKVDESEFYVDYMDFVCNIKKKLYKEYRTDIEYFQRLEYHSVNIPDDIDAILGAYVGNYTSIADAEANGAKNIKDELFGATGYKENYSKTICFTIFVKVSETAAGEPIIVIWHLGILAEEGEKSSLSNHASVDFSGLKNAEGEQVTCYIVDANEDSYAAYNYLTILVDKDVDLSQLAPVFFTDENAKLYTEGSSVAEVSGKSIHDFSKGPIQYTVSAEDGKNSKNYWVQIIQPTEEGNFLYLNSLADPASITEGIISKREIMMDYAHGNQHDILLINMGADTIAEAAVELVSDVVELDEYWTLKGSFALESFDGSSNKSGIYDELSNMAKLRLKTKGGVSEGSVINGTLTVKSGKEELLVLELTGMVGIPRIRTTQIPEAVKYVPYGTMIQNSNKYNWNRVNYSISDGKLPEGMVLKPNGELYGVPKESGEFVFTVQLENCGSRYDFDSDYMTFAFEVKENTNENVDNATDIGYDVTTRIQNLYVGEKQQNQLFVSAGAFGELVDVYLDGERLIAGTDYTAESGSTRITIMAETLDEGLDEGTHTLGVEFRDEEDSLKIAAQNFDVVRRGSTGENAGGSTGGTSTVVTPETTPTSGATSTPQPTVTVTPTPTPPPTAIPTAIPTPEPTSTLAPTKVPDAGVPFVKNDKEIVGWDAIKELVKEALEDEVIIVDMNHSTIVPGEIIEEIASKDVSIRLEMRDGISWEINGKTVTSDKIGDIDFEVLIGEDANEIPMGIVNNVTGERYFLNITLAHNGEFGFTAVLCINVGKKNSGLYANLFYYNGTEYELEFVCARQIDRTGIARLSFTHASDYVIIIDHKAMDGSDQKDKADNDNPVKEDGSSGGKNDRDLPKTSLKDSIWFFFAGMLIILVDGAVLLVAYGKKQCR